MSDLQQTWNLTADQWRRVAEQCRSTHDLLADGAYVRYDAEADELHFYATPFSKPAGWQYPFLEPVPDARSLGAFIGRAWHDQDAGIAQLDVILYAAAQALRADYESDVSDMDYVTYEQAVEQAVRGTDADRLWLRQEFGRLLPLTMRP